MGRSTDSSAVHLTDGSRRYSLAPDLRIRKLDDDAIVFNAFSWETHLLNPAAALVLELAASGSPSEADVVNLLAEVLQDSERQEALHHARHLLSELVNLRIVAEQPSFTDAGR